MEFIFSMVMLFIGYGMGLRDGASYVVEKYKKLPLGEKVKYLLDEFEAKTIQANVDKENLRENLHFMKQYAAKKEEELEVKQNLNAS